MQRDITTLGELKKSGYRSRSIKTEMRENLIHALRHNINLFEGIIGFEDTVIPDIQRAVLSRHNILLLGLRGQAKTRIARLAINLLDEYIPVLSGSELNDDPLMPVSRQGKDLVTELGDAAPVSMLHRSERYVEKLATPDVSIADLIGDVDPIKAATLKLPYSDERVIHFGLVPRSHRCIFVMNELPDLQARIQVSLFNMLEEGDMQIRGFKLRLPLDIQFIFTANPEDYTSRGSIITPLKDRIQSQILTHYPVSLQESRQITMQEASVLPEQKETVHVPEFLQNIIEQIAVEARDSEWVDESSGVSARLSISAYENLVSTAERRCIMKGQNNTIARVCDLWGVIPSITGKIELRYEGEQEGTFEVAVSLIEEAIKKIFPQYFPDLRESDESSPYDAVKMWFADGHRAEIHYDWSDEQYRTELDRIPGLNRLLKDARINTGEEYVMKEFLLHGLAEAGQINRETLDGQLTFSDFLAEMLSDEEGDYDDEDLM